MSHKSGRRYLVGFVLGAMCLMAGIVLATTASASPSFTASPNDSTTTPPDLQFNVNAQQVSCAVDNSGQDEVLYNVTLASGTVSSNESGTVTVSFTVTGQTPVTDTFPLNDLAASNGGHHTHTVVLGAGFAGQTVSVVASISTPVTGYGSTTVDDTCTAPVTTTTTVSSTTTTVPSTTTTVPSTTTTAPPATTPPTTSHTSPPPSNGSSGPGNGSSGSSGTLGPKVVTDYVGGSSNSAAWFISIVLIALGVAICGGCGLGLRYSRQA